MRTVLLLASLVFLGAAACAHAPDEPCVAAPPLPLAATTVPTPAAPVVPVPPAIASAAPGDDFHARLEVARASAVRFASNGDFEHAAGALVAVLPELAKHPESADEFWTHNAMMMIREAQGDPAAALAENDQATLAAARGTWEPEERETLAYLKDRWHRAYLTRMLAESRTGSVRQALVVYAEASLDDYRVRARQRKSNEESIAVLEAYFAALDGRREDALRAAKKVDPDKDDDVEDLYLVVVGLEAGGDHAAAEAVRRVMRKSGGLRLSSAVMLRWLEHDAKPGDKAFTPWHAKGVSSPPLDR